MLITALLAGRYFPDFQVFRLIDLYHLLRDISSCHDADTTLHQTNVLTAYTDETLTIHIHLSSSICAFTAAPVNANRDVINPARTTA